jgi:hypothetical protein
MYVKVLEFIIFFMTIGGTVSSSVYISKSSHWIIVERNIPCKTQQAMRIGT